MEASYITSALKAQQLPRFSLPEVAFIGRSNTGKSTLLNALLGRKNLARASRTPGRTQMVNFFDVGGERILVDLPGYGFSVAGREVQQHWQTLMDAYLNRQNIQDFLFLIDSRRELNDEDLGLLGLMAKRIPVIVVATKSDKLSKAACLKAIGKLESQLMERLIPVKRVYAVSALSKAGLEELRRAIQLI